MARKAAPLTTVDRTFVKSTVRKTHTGYQWTAGVCKESYTVHKSGLSADRAEARTFADAAKEAIQRKCSATRKRDKPRKRANKRR